MQPPLIHLRALLLCALLALGACGGGGGSDAPAPAPVPVQTPVVLGQPGPGDPDDRLPLAVGHWWHFSGTGTGEFSGTVDNSVAVTGTRVVSTPVAQGVTALVLRESNPDTDGLPVETAVVKDANGVATLVATAVADALASRLAPYWEARFPLQPGSEFVQLARTEVDLGEDLDGDGRNETLAELRSTVRVVGLERVQVPAGTFDDALRIDRRVTLVLRLSESSVTVEGSESGSAWLARGVGWVKRTRTVVAAGSTSTLSEELDAYYVNGVTGGLAVKADRAALSATLAAGQTRYWVYPGLAAGYQFAAIAGLTGNADLSVPSWGPCLRGNAGAFDTTPEECVFLHTGGSAVVRARAAADARFALWVAPQPAVPAPVDESAMPALSLPLAGQVGPRGQSAYSTLGLAPGSYLIAIAGISEDADLQVFADGTYSMELDCTLRAPGDVGTLPSNCTVESTTGDLYFKVRSGELNRGGAAFSILVAPAP